LNKLTSISYI